MAQQPKVADAIVRSGIPVVLEIPPVDMTFNVIGRVVRSALAIVHRGHHDDVPIWQCSAHTPRNSARLVRDTDRVGTNGQMRTMLLDHSDR